MEEKEKKMIGAHRRISSTFSHSLQQLPDNCHTSKSYELFLLNSINKLIYENFKHKNYTSINYFNESIEKKWFSMQVQGTN